MAAVVGAVAVAAVAAARAPTPARVRPAPTPTTHAVRRIPAPRLAAPRSRAPGLAAPGLAAEPLVLAAGAASTASGRRSRPGSQVLAQRRQTGRVPVRMRLGPPVRGDGAARARIASRPHLRKR